MPTFAILDTIEIVYVVFVSLAYHSSVYLFLIKHFVVRVDADDSRRRCLEKRHDIGNKH
jgi:hypothetical protein